MTINYEKRLITIVRNQDWLMNILKAVRNLELPDWYIAAGAIRNTVWSKLHNYSDNIKLNDIDVVYFDSKDLTTAKEKETETRLSKLFPELVFEVVNQARAHTFNKGRPQATSSCDAISYWTETPTCVGVRLEKDDSITICAPYGLEDLFELRVKPIPLPKRDIKLYEKRKKIKQWDKTWPKLKIS